MTVAVVVYAYFYVIISKSEVKTTYFKTRLSVLHYADSDFLKDFFMTDAEENYRKFLLLLF